MKVNQPIKNMVPVEMNNCTLNNDWAKVMNKGESERLQIHHDAFRCQLVIRIEAVERHER